MSAPYVYRLYVDIILSTFDEKNVSRKNSKIGITRQEIMNKHYEVHGRMLNALVLGQPVLPMLTQAGLVN